MNVVCTHCQTANREGAMFCRGCIAKLPAFVATGPAAIDVMKAFPKTSNTPGKNGGATASWMDDPEPMAGYAIDFRSSAVFWRAGAAALALTLIIVGWYAWVTRRVEPDATPMSVATSKEMLSSASAATPARPSATVKVPPSAQQPLHALQPVQPSETLSPGEALAAPGVLGAADVDKSTRSESFMEREATPAPLRERSNRIAMAPQQTPIEPPARSAASDPRAACSSLNFVMASRCEAVQCAKPAFSRHPRCDAVRALTRRDVARRDLAF